MRLRARAIVVWSLAFSAAALGGHSRPAFAQTGQPPSEEQASGDPGIMTEPMRAPPSADFKGAIGGGLLGAEVGVLVPALLGARATWEYIVFPSVGAAAGTFVGYMALERGDGHPSLAVGTLVAGMALAIPVVVATLALVAQEPSTEVPLRTSQGRSATSALVHVSPTGVALGPPAIALSMPVLSTTQATRASHGHRVDVALLSGVF